MTWNIKLYISLNL